MCIHELPPVYISKEQTPRGKSESWEDAKYERISNRRGGHQTLDQRMTSPFSSRGVIHVWMCVFKANLHETHGES